MLRAREIVLALFLTNGIHGKQNAKEKEDDTREETYQRHVIEEGVKAAIFGSNSYDPINQVFESLQESNNTEGTNTTTEVQDRKFFEEQTLSGFKETLEPPNTFTAGKALTGGDSWWSGYKFRVGQLNVTQ